MIVKSITRTFAIALLLGLPAIPALADDETRNVDHFQAISVSGGIDLDIHQGDRFAVIVHADSGEADEVETEVHGETLVIRKVSGFLGFFRFGFYHWFEHYSVDVTLPKLEKVAASGGSNVVFATDFAGEELELRVSGGCNLHYKGKVASLDVTASGGSDAYLQGTTKLLKVRASGGSDLHALKLDASEAELNVSGGSDAVVTVHDTLSVRASGGSDVRYEGHPEHTDIKSSGGSDVKAR